MQFIMQNRRGFRYKNGNITINCNTFLHVYYDMFYINLHNFTEN